MEAFCKRIVKLFITKKRAVFLRNATLFFVILHKKYSKHNRGIPLQSFAKVVTHSRNQSKHNQEIIKRRAIAVVTHLKKYSKHNHIHFLLKVLLVVTHLKKYSKHNLNRINT